MVITYWGTCSFKIKTTATRLLFPSIVLGTHTQTQNVQAWHWPTTTVQRKRARSASDITGSALIPGLSIQQEVHTSPARSLCACYGKVFRRIAVCCLMPLQAALALTRPLPLLSLSHPLYCKTPERVSQSAENFTRKEFQGSSALISCKVCHMWVSDNGLSVTKSEHFGPSVTDIIGGKKRWMRIRDANDCLIH